MKRFCRLALFRTLFCRWAALAAYTGCALMIGCDRQSSQEGPARSESAKTPTDKSPPPEAKSPSAREVLGRMAAAYRKASSYADAGTVHLLAEAGGRTTHDETANFSLALVRPNKVRIQAYQAMVVCDGEKLYAALENVPGQVLKRPAPRK